MKKLVLGTAQFGFDYGISNETGQPSTREVFDILDYAQAEGIDLLDTAFTYGGSEAIIGQYIFERGEKFGIISKLPTCPLEQIDGFVRESLNKLHIKSFYGLLFHDFNFYKQTPQSYNFVFNLKRQKKTAKIGFSLYSPSELEYLFEQNIEFDLIQVPYSIFDRRFEPYFPTLVKKKVEVFARSIFLQGLVFKPLEGLDPFFVGLRDKLVNVDELSKRSGIPIWAICLNFVFSNPDLDKVIVGVDGLMHLKQVLSAFVYADRFRLIKAELDHCKEENEDYLLPYKWKLVKK